MIDKNAVESLLNEFNEQRKADAKLHQLTEKKLLVKASAADPDKFFEELKHHIKQGLKMDFELRGIKKQAKMHTAIYDIKGLDPAEEIIRVLDRYYEGTTRKHECCDD